MASRLLSSRPARNVLPFRPPKRVRLSHSNGVRLSSKTLNETRSVWVTQTDAFGSLKRNPVFGWAKQPRLAHSNSPFGSPKRGPESGGAFGSPKRPRLGRPNGDPNPEMRLSHTNSPVWLTQTVRLAHPNGDPNPGSVWATQML